MIDPCAEYLGANRAVDDNGVPVFFVHVKAWLDAGVALAEFCGFLRVAFDIKLLRGAVQWHEAEYLAVDLVDDHVWTERKGFLSVG